MSSIQGTLAQWRDRLRRKELSPAELVNLTADAIEADRTTNAYISFDREAALKAAAAADTSSPLAGIPIAVKDNINVLGQPTRCASRLLAPYASPYDATSIRLLKAAGGIPLGRTNMDEFAMGASGENSAYGVTRNPNAPDHIPGGSSSGSAAAVASATAIAALGSDTGGSIRQPAGHCGIVGLKPTYGRVSRYGLVAFASSLDQIGPMTRTVEDAAILLQAISGHDPKDSTSADEPVPDFEDALGRDVKGLKVGIPAEYFTSGNHPGISEAVQNTVRQLESLGAELVEISLPHADAVVAAYYIIACAEASSNLSRFDGVRYGRRAPDVKNLEELYVKSRSEGFGQEVKRRIMLGAYVLSSGYYDAYYRKAAQVRRLIRDEYLAALEQCDVLCAPVSPVTAWDLGSHAADPLQAYLMDAYTLSLNLAGLPGLSLPVGLGAESGMPVGLQLIGPAFGEARLLGIGHALERALPGIGRPAL